MRFVVFGAGAIGGVVGARLHQSGHDVALIARGRHFEAIRRDGLTLETPNERAVLAIPVVDSPEGLDWSGDEVVLLAVKSQDTAGALAGLRALAPSRTPVVCVQNAVENERVALRLFEDVYGAVVMSPTGHLEPGIVQAYGTWMSGVIDLGCYPSGVDERSREIAEALAASHFSSESRPDVMRFKYAKLISNLPNAVDAIVEPGPGAAELSRLAQDEGRAVLDAAEIEFVADEANDVLARWKRLALAPIAGRERAGSSTRQSLARGLSLETDYLNGEISLIGRMHGLPTPVNDALCRLSVRAVRDRLAPQSVPAEDVLADTGTRNYTDGQVRR
jgi:2-dehydropantoate 2-reductase